MSEQPEAIDVLIADDHPIFRQGLRKLLEAEPGMRVVGEAADGEEVVKLVREIQPKVLLLDLSMPKMPGLEALRELSRSGIQTHTIILAAAIEKEQVVEAFQWGAHGIVLKHSALPVLLKSIRCVNEGQFWVGQESVSDLIHALRQMVPQPQAARASQDFGLTPREVEVIGLIVAGYTNKDLAHKLGISEHTAKHHLTNIFDKLGVSNRLELVLFAIDHRLVNGE